MSKTISPVGFLPRFFGAFGQFFKYLGSGNYAARCQLIGAGEKFAFEQAPEVVTETVEVIREVEKPTLMSASSDGALQLLQLLQQEARFIDFVQEPIDAYTDAEVGAAARQIHAGCSKVALQYFSWDKAYQGDEGARVEVPAGYDPHQIRLEGRIQGEGPFAGTLIHPGWTVTQVDLPQIADTAALKIIAPAQVEV
ncbi:DUF2760 domain-containing protein [Maribrevibacterium harenarium]|uniref:DUF2760 domain-containing protein n=1 Tax=Maribrevibacterium harenarium TaxID=2589817 RepID=A0A501X5A8_9GAMM|nr:DUF2760 domain-containing protein [Maribrevibacterium harenarium]TPE55587.1 DUF2760 domain-containing protein [Maribrevibacterium harenarium]